MKKIKFSKLEINNSFKILTGSGKEKETMQPHLSDRDAFLLVTKGSILFNLNGKSTYLSKDNGIPIPKDVVHSFSVVDPCDVMLTLDADASIKFV